MKRTETEIRLCYDTPEVWVEIIQTEEAILQGSGSAERVEDDGEEHEW